MTDAFLLSLFAGLSTVLGSVFVFVKFKNENLLIGGVLSFASGVMIAVSFLELIPEAFINLLDIFYVFPTLLITILFIIFGIIIVSMSNNVCNNISINTNILYKTGIFSMIAIVLHNIPEGIVTFLTATTNIKLGFSLAVAIALHNIPEGISVSVPIYYSTRSKAKAIWYTFSAGISEFLGAIIACLCLRNINITFFLELLYLVIAGIMISLVVDELIPTAFRYLNFKANISMFLFGFIFMIIIIFIL